jgi:CRP/FNR family transcriptional regulator, cyclic AMP receptor protein
MSSSYLDQRVYEVGDVIFTEGDTTAEMFIVQEGTVAVMKDVAGRSVFLATLQRGDFFGEMPLFDGQPRHATCYALAPTRLLAIKSGELLIKLRRDPTFALEMIQTMSRRVRYLEEQVTRMMEDQVLSRHEFTKAMARSEYHLRERHP